MPFWAHFESTIFYPLGFLFWMIPPDKAYGYTMFLHFVLAGIFMYILARSLGIGRTGSFVAGAVFTCNGFLMALLYLGQMCPVQSYIWLPLIIFFLNRATSSKKYHLNAAIAGMFWGIQILAGAPQDAFYTLIASCTFLAFHLKGRHTKGQHPLKLSVIAFFLFFIGSGIASIQIFPAFELIYESVRASLNSYDMATMSSYPPEGIITAIMPYFFGEYTENSFWVSNVPWSIPQQNLYIGILPIILLFFISYRSPENKKIILFAGTLAILSFLLALGVHTPVYKIVYLLPGFDKFRSLFRIFVLWVFSFGLLAGKGMDAFLKHRSKSTIKKIAVPMGVLIAILTLYTVSFFDKSIILKIFSPFILNEVIPQKLDLAESIIQTEIHRFSLFLSVYIFLILLRMRGFINAKICALFLCAFLLLDLGLTHKKTIQSGDIIYHSMEKAKHDLDSAIGRDKSIFRIGSFHSDLGPNLEMYIGYHTVGGFTALILHRYHEYINQHSGDMLKEGWQFFFYGRSENHKLMDLLNVKYEAAHDRRKYYLRKTYFPRSFLVPHGKILNKEKILETLCRPDFDPYRVVLFEKDEGQLKNASGPLENKAIGSRVNMISYRPDHILLSTNHSESSFLFLSEIFYPGWKAYIDGQPTPILRGNYLFRVINLPKGDHSVSLVFDPLSIRLGIGVTIFTLFIFLNVVIYHFGNRIPFLSRRSKRV
jgi:hypothetical protein